MFSYSPLPGCCEQLLIGHKENITNVFQAHPSLFQLYEIENTFINENAHYTSDEGKWAISFASCGLWTVQSSDYRLCP